MFAAVPFTASAKTYDSDSVDLGILEVGDVVTSDVKRVTNNDAVSIVLKGGRYGNLNALISQDSVEISRFTIEISSDTMRIVQSTYNINYFYDEAGNQVNSFIVLDKSGNTITIGGYTVPEITELLNSSVSYRQYDGTYFINSQTPAEITYKVVPTNKTWTDGNWYVVTEDVTVAHRITVNGTVNLILCDGAKLTAPEGISVNEGNALNIYAQSSGTGTLYAGTQDGTSTSIPARAKNAAIGSDAGRKGSAITIHGGNIAALSNTGAAGIGAGNRGVCGTVTVYGGSVTAGCTGGSGAGVGSGYYGVSMAFLNTFSVLGGHVTAYGYGDSHAAAIGHTAEMITLTVADDAIIKAGDSASDAQIVNSTNDVKKKAYVEIDAGTLPLSVGQVGDTHYETFDEALAAWTDGSTLTLLSDVTTTNTINVSGTMTLDLNGFTVEKSGSTASSIFSVQSGATLNLYDDKNGSLTNTSDAADGGGISVDGGTLNMYGGLITGCSATRGGGLFAHGGTINLFGGTIRNCSATRGGGVYADGGTVNLGGALFFGCKAVSGGGFYLNGARINVYHGSIQSCSVDATRSTGHNGSKFRSNTAARSDSETGHGGAVLVTNGGSFYMTDGVISGNEATYGAVSLQNDAAAVIVGGTLSSNTLSDVYLEDGIKLVIDPAFTNTDPIFVDMETPGVFTNGLSGNSSSVRFDTHKEGYAVALSGDGEAQLVPAYSVTWQNWDGTLLKTDTNVAEGAAPTYNGETPTKAEDNAYTYTFSGWSDGMTTYALDETLSAVTADVTYTAAFRRTAKPDQQFVTVDDQISLTLALNLGTRGVEPDAVSITLAGNAYDAEAVAAGEGVYNYKIEMAPAQMNDEIVVTIEGDADPLTTSVKAYCDSLSASSAASAKDKALALAMLNYGQAANNVFGYTGATIATLDAMDKDAVQTASATFTDGTGAVTGASFMALTKPEFRFYTAGIDEQTAYAYNEAGVSATMANGGDTLNARFVKKADGKVLLEVKGISAENLDKTVTVTVTGLGTITFNGNAFAKAMAKSGNTQQSDLGAALYNYGAAAKACFA